MTAQTMDKSDDNYNTKKAINLQVYETDSVLFQDASSSRVNDDNTVYDTSLEAMSHHRSISKTPAK